MNRTQKKQIGKLVADLIKESDDFTLIYRVKGEVRLASPADPLACISLFLAASPGVFEQVISRIETIKDATETKIISKE